MNAVTVRSEGRSARLYLGGLSEENSSRWGSLNKAQLTRCQVGLSPAGCNRRIEALCYYHTVTHTHTHCTAQGPVTHGESQRVSEEQQHAGGAGTVSQKRSESTEPASPGPSRAHTLCTAGFVGFREVKLEQGFMQELRLQKFASSH